MKGVWVVGSYDVGFAVDSIHETELDALRKVNAQGYGKAIPVGFGVDITEAVKEAGA